MVILLADEGKDARRDPSPENSERCRYLIFYLIHIMFHHAL